MGPLSPLVTLATAISGHVAFVQALLCAIACFVLLLASCHHFLCPTACFVPQALLIPSDVLIPPLFCSLLHDVSLLDAACLSMPVSLEPLACFPHVCNFTLHLWATCICQAIPFFMPPVPLIAPPEHACTSHAACIGHAACTFHAADILYAPSLSAFHLPSLSQLPASFRLPNVL